jgi:hypothetical protein
VPITDTIAYSLADADSNSNFLADSYSELDTDLLANPHDHRIADTNVNSDANVILHRGDLLRRQPERGRDGLERGNQ